MATYSHSKLNCFENCPYQYKLKYIDKIETEFPNTIECFMGDLVHQTLEFLYLNKKQWKDISKKSILDFYNSIWEKNFTEDILIVKKELDAEHYKQLGIKFIEDYYNRFVPFEEMTLLGLETQDFLNLPDGNKWHVRIDKFGCNEENDYYICDYKTGSKMKMQLEAENDQQLAMYSLWVLDKFKDAKKIILRWHMLAHDRDVEVEKTRGQLNNIQEQVVQKINKIEKSVEENNFPKKESGLCNYCPYQKICRGNSETFIK